MSNLEILQRMHNLTVEAADALRAIQKNKNTDRDPSTICADIQENRPNVIRALAELQNPPVLRRMFGYCIDAATALQSNARNHRMIEINQDIHRLRPEVDQLLAKMAKEQPPLIKDFSV